MTTQMNHPLLADYLTRLGAAAASLPPEQRAELIGDIEAHLRDATADGGASEAEIRSVLDRLGPAEEVAAEAREWSGYAAPAAGAVAPLLPRRATREVTSLVLFAVSGALMATLVGAPLAVLAWLPALVLLLISSLWSGREKLAGGLVLGVLGSPLLWVLAGFGAFYASPQVCVSGADAVDAGTGEIVGQSVERCSGGPPAWAPWVAGAAVIALVVAWLVVWIRLWRSAHRLGPTG